MSKNLKNNGIRISYFLIFFRIDEFVVLEIMKGYEISFLEYF